jgi:hypothetical protein
MSTLVTGLFGSRSAAQVAIEHLIDQGFAREDISILMSDTTRGREFGVLEHSKAPEGAATGATIGGVLGALAAGLAGVGSLAVPGLSLVAAGPLVAALAGLGAGAAAGGITGAMIGLGMPEHEAKFFHDEIRRGGILVGVYAHFDRVQFARELLDAAGAENVRS